MANKQSGPFWPWLHAGLQNVTQRFGQNGETGVDMGMPMGTPITSLTDGQVLGMGYYGGGGVVSVKSSVQGKTASVYYQHLDLISPTIAVGSTVKPGDMIGWSGGQLSGGHHPSTPQFSSGPHLEVGLNAPFGGMWHPLGANRDPLPWLRYLDAHGPAAAALYDWLLPPGVKGAVSGSGNDWLPYLQALDARMQFPSQGIDPFNAVGSTVGWVTSSVEAFTIRAIVTIAGLLIVLAFLWNIIKGSVEASGISDVAGAAIGDATL